MLKYIDIFIAITIAVINIFISKNNFILKL